MAPSAPTGPDPSAAWRAAVDRVLKGASFKTLMMSATADGIPVRPLYPKAEAPAPQPLRAGGRVDVVQRIDHPDPRTANHLALADLAGGADGLTIILDGAPRARGFGVRTGPGLFATLLAGIEVGALALRLEAPAATAAANAEALAQWIEVQGPGPAAVRVDFGLGAENAGLALALRRRGFAAPAMRADARRTQEAGGTEAQELAALLAEAAAMLRALEAAGATPDEMADLVGVVLVADTDLFLTLAKLRAVRRLWACVAQACGLDPRPLRLHAETAWRSMTRRDPWTNLLRGGVAAAGAIMGGADSLTILPFTAPLGLPDAFARRLARNTGHILLDEAHLARLSDPAGGAGAFEAFTEDLCDRAWTAFQAIEAAGGFAAALRSGFWPARVAESRARRRHQVEAGERPILGTSVFPPPEAALPPVLMEAPPEPGDDAGGLPSLRDAAVLERAPDHSDAETGR